MAHIWLSKMCVSEKNVFLNKLVFGTDVKKKNYIHFSEKAITETVDNLRDILMGQNIILCRN